MTLGAGADAGDWVALLLLPLPPPPDCAITNATTATTTTSPSTAQRVPVFIEDLLQSVSDPRRTVRRRSDQTEVSGGPRPARKHARGSGEGWKTGAGEATAGAAGGRGRNAAADVRGSVAAGAPRAASATKPPTSRAPASAIPPPASSPPATPAGGPAAAPSPEHPWAP